MKSQNLIIATITGILLSSGTSFAEGNKNVTLKWNLFVPAKEPTYAHVIKPFAEKIAAETNGVVKIDTFPGGGLGRNPRAQLKLMADRVAVLVMAVPAYNPGRFPDNEVFELPGLFKSATEASVAIWRMYSKGKLRGYDKFVVPLLVCTHPYMIHSKKPINRMNDLKGMKIRVAGPVFGRVTKEMGATPVGMAAPAIAENMSRGVIDAVALEWVGYTAWRIIDVAKYHYHANLGCVPLMSAMNKQSFDSLPAIGKAAFRNNWGEKLSRAHGRTHDGLQNGIETKMIKTGVNKVVRPTGTDLKALDAAKQRAIEGWQKSHPRGKELLAAVRAELTAIRAGK